MLQKTIFSHISFTSSSGEGKKEKKKKLHHFEKWESAYPLHLQRFTIKLTTAKKMLYLLKEILFLMELRNFVPFILSKEAKALIKMQAFFARFVQVVSFFEFCALLLLGCLLKLGNFLFV